MITIWLAEAENGTIQFDTEPSETDIGNVCEDLEGTIEVYELTLIETKRVKLFEMPDTR